MKKIINYYILFFRPFNQFLKVLSLVNNLYIQNMKYIYNLKSHNIKIKCKEYINLQK